MKKLDSILWGIFFILLGTILGLNALDITNINIFFDGWWTLFIIIPSFISLFRDKNKTGSLVGIIIGVTLLLVCLDYIDFGVAISLAFPLLFIVIGLVFIFKSALNNKIAKEIRALNDSVEEKTYKAILKEEKVELNDEFEGCNIKSIFGEVVIDLTSSSIKDNSIIKTTSVFGSTIIYIPDDVEVKISSTSIFGGVEEKKKTKATKKKIYVDSTCVFGGVEIR